MERMKFKTADRSEVNIKKLAEIFPNVMTEGKVDFEKLRQELTSDVVDEGDECYDFTWVGKKAAMVEANRPTTKTLRPCKEESVNFDTTENLYIEGDNLEVLKLLQESYFAKIKMIYIDPPYNTGNDFIYNDDFKMESDEYKDVTGEVDEDGNRMFKNSDTNGRYHSDWCSMIYSRLKLARNLLTDDGVIFISIDEHEFYNIINICNQIFGENNYIENFIWVKNSTKNLSKTTSTNHEYIICYAKNRNEVEKLQIFRKQKEGLNEVREILDRCEEEGKSAKEAEVKLRVFYKENPNYKGISMYNNVDEIIDEKTKQKHLKAFRISDISAPVAAGSGARYEVLHPITGLPCVSPSRGWAYTRETMNKHIAAGLIYFNKDESYVPAFKRFLDTVETDVMKSVIEDFTDGKKELMKLFDGQAYFENAKPTTIIKRFIELYKDDAIILDFFSGSATTAHAVMKLNAEDGGHRKFIMVQLPEKTDELSEAYKQGFKNICEIGKERIRRAAKAVSD